MQNKVLSHGGGGCLEKQKERKGKALGVKILTFKALVNHAKKILVIFHEGKLLRYLSLFYTLYMFLNPFLF